MKIAALLPVHHEAMLSPFEGTTLLRMLLSSIHAVAEAPEILMAPSEGLSAPCRAVAEEAGVAARMWEEGPAWFLNSRAELEAVSKAFEETGAEGLLYLPPGTSLFEGTAWSFTVKAAASSERSLAWCYLFPGCGFTLLRNDLLPAMRESLSSDGPAASLSGPRFHSASMNWTQAFLSAHPELPLNFWALRTAVPLLSFSKATREVIARAARRRGVAPARVSIFDIARALDEEPDLLELQPRSLFLEVSTRDDAPPLYAPLRNGIRADDRPPFLPREIWRRTIEASLREYGPVVNLHLGGIGEPFLHPEMEGMLGDLRDAAAAGRRFQEVNLWTDARHLNDRLIRAVLEAGVSSLMISLDAVDPDLYAKIRPGARYDEARGNLDRLIEAKRGRYREGGAFPPLPILAVTIAHIRALEAHIDAFFEAFPPRDEFVRRYVSSRSLPPGGEMEALRAFYDAGQMVEYTVIQGASTYAGRIPDLRAQNFTPLHRFPCRRLGRTLFIRTDGSVVPCDRVLGPEESVLGNVMTTNSLQDLWEAAAGLRAAHRKGSPGEALPLCAACEDWHIPVD